MSRASAAVLLVVVVGLGLLVQLWRGPAWSDAVGTVLYAVAVGLVVVLVRPRTGRVALGLVTLGICLLVELAQLTDLPGRVPFARLLLGSTFSRGDLPWYAVGSALVAVLVGLRRARERC